MPFKGVLVNLEWKSFFIGHAVDFYKDFIRSFKCLENILQEICKNTVWNIKVLFICPNNHQKILQGPKYFKKISKKNMKVTFYFHVINCGTLKRFYKTWRPLYSLFHVPPRREIYWWKQPFTLFFSSGQDPNVQGWVYLQIL